MDDAAAVRERDGVARPQEDLEEAAKVIAAALEPRRERLALDELHRELGRRLRVVEVVDRDDVRVIELAGDARLVEEALALVWMIAQRPIHHLERDVPLEVLVEHLADDALPAARDFAAVGEPTFDPNALLGITALRGRGCARRSGG